MDRKKDKPVLVFIFSMNCGGCTVFKRTVFPSLEKELPHDKIKVQILEFPTMDIPLTGKINLGPGKTVNYHPQLKYHIKQFPSFILVNGKNWENSNLPLSPIICETENYNKQGILNWIAKSLPLLQQESTSENYVFKTGNASQSSTSTTTNHTGNGIIFNSSTYDSD